MQKDKRSLTTRLYGLFLVVSFVNGNIISKIRYKICIGRLWEGNVIAELPVPLIFALLALDSQFIYSQKLYTRRLVFSSTNTLSNRYLHVCRGDHMGILPFPQESES